VYVGQLAVRAGAVLPPVVADAKSKRLVDGWHRVRAYRKVLGAAGVVDCDLRAYRSEPDLLLDAIALNASHGRKLDRIDQVRSVLLAEQAGIAEEQISIALRITKERVATLRIRVAIAPASTQNGASTGPVRIALKRPMAHLAGQELTADQMRAHDGAAGTSFLLQVHQVRDALKFDLMNRQDGRLMEALRELQGELGRYLKALPPPSAS
jgi:hypothetical protein